MMRRIVARDFGDDFRERDYEATPQSAHSPFPTLRLVAGSARHIYQIAKRTLHKRKLARTIGPLPGVPCHFCRRVTPHCQLGGYR
ncbi:MAG: hypothetical protein GY906_27810 [bacterium]|nr:hypothetical protein [bacterium]